MGVVKITLPHVLSDILPVRNTFVKICLHAAAGVHNLQCFAVAFFFFTWNFNNGQLESVTLWAIPSLP